MGVKDGSAYDLFLTRTLRHAEIVRGADGTTVFEEQGLDVASGIRVPVTEYAGAHRHAGAGAALHGDPAGRRHDADPAASTVAWMGEIVEELKADRLRRGRAGPLGPERRRGGAAPDLNTRGLAW